MDETFETRYVTVVIMGDGHVRIASSDGLFGCGEKTVSEFQKCMDELTLGGWKLVCTLDHPNHCEPHTVMDLFFRRIVEKQPGAQLSVG